MSISKLYLNNQNQLPTLEEVQDYVCLGNQVNVGFYQIENGIIEVCGEDEDYEIVLIK